MPVYVPIASVMSKAYAVKPNASPLWVIKMLLRIKIKRSGGAPFYLLLAGRPSTKIEPWLPLPVR